MPKPNTTYSNTGPVNLSPNNKSVTCSHNDELSRTNSTLTNSIILARGQLSVIVYTPTVYAHANSLPYWLQMSYTTYPNPTQNYPTLPYPNPNPNPNTPQHPHPNPHHHPTPSACLRTFICSRVPQIILSWFNVNSMRRRSVCSRVPQINFS